MKIKLNQVFSTIGSKEYVQWKTLTRGGREKPININKGIEFFKIAAGRTPLINFHSNPYKEDKEHTPWRDLIFPEKGKVIYNGDNKNAKSKAHEPRGNKKVLDVLGLYFSKKREDRLKAPPIIVTQSIKINDKISFRKFVGIGLIHHNPKLVQQFEKDTNHVFSNFQFEVTLVALTPEEEFDWTWIDDRRNPNLSDEESLKSAPKKWKRWIEKGNDCIDEIQQRIKSYRIVSEKKQREMPAQNKNIIDELLNKYYPNPTKDGVRFEALASFITGLYFEDFDYHRGWITEGTGDRGVDFVGRLNVGHDSFSNTSIIVLGQSKRYKSSISGERLTRVASRMTRGYIGVVVTLDTFTGPAQEEIKDDQLPIILINGKKASELLLTYMNKTNTSLQEIVNAQNDWVTKNLRTVHYNSIIDEI